MSRDERTALAELYDAADFYAADVVPVEADDRNHRARTRPTPNDPPRAVGSGRRKNWKPMHPLTLLAAQVWMGLSLGTTWAALVFGATRVFRPEWMGHLRTLATVSPILGLVLLGAMRWQIRAIREQTFLRKVRGEREKKEIRIRRRGEVLTTLVLRGLGWSVVAAALLVGMQAAISYYRLTVIAGRPFVFSPPAIGGDVILVAAAIGIHLLGLLPVEGIFRVSAKQGYRGQGAALFVPSTLAFAGVLAGLASL